MSNKWMFAFLQDATRLFCYCVRGEIHDDDVFRINRWVRQNDPKVMVFTVDEGIASVHFSLVNNLSKNAFSSAS